jgi:hypothetical protein
MFDFDAWFQSVYIPFSKRQEVFEWLKSNYFTTDGALQGLSFAWDDEILPWSAEVNCALRVGIWRIPNRSGRIFEPNWSAAARLRMKVADDLMKTSRRRGHVDSIRAEHQKIPFISSKNDTVSKLHEYIMQEVNIPSNSRQFKGVHSIAVLAAISGFGKTRTILELQNFVEKFNKEKDNQALRHIVHLYVTFSDPYAESDWEQSYKWASMLLAWRMLYFYFSPTTLWRNVINIIKEDSYLVEMSISEAMAIISADVRRQNSLPDTVEVVLLLCIDNYERIAESDAKYSRLKCIVREITRVMYTQGRNVDIVVPILAGLYVRPLYEDVTGSIPLTPILMTLPLDYDCAAEIVREYTKDPTVMMNKDARDVVAKLSAIPGHLFDIMNLSVDHKNKDWNFRLRLLLSDYHRHHPHQLDAKTTELVVAFSLVGLPVPREICSAVTLERGGFSWFRDRYMLWRPNIGITFLAMHEVVPGDSGDTSRAFLAIRPRDLTFLDGFRESLGTILCDKYHHSLPLWRQFVLWPAYHLTLMLNSLGLASAQQRREHWESITLVVLNHAYVRPYVADMEMVVKPIVVQLCEARLDCAYKFRDIEQEQLVGYG